MITFDKMNGLPEKQDFTQEDREFMQMAIELSIENIDNGGGPFGAVIVRNGKLISKGANRVVPNNDPTAHAEVVAIRRACAELNTFDLSGCTVYTSCEPCPMCLSALYWAGIKRICYANTKRDAAAIDFDDSFIYDQLRLDYDKRSIECEHFMRSEALRAACTLHRTVVYIGCSGRCDERICGTGHTCREAILCAKALHHNGYNRFYTSYLGSPSTTRNRPGCRTPRRRALIARRKCRG